MATIQISRQRTVYEYIDVEVPDEWVGNDSYLTEVASKSEDCDSWVVRKEDDEGAYVEGERSDKEPTARVVINDGDFTVEDI